MAELLSPQRWRRIKDVFNDALDLGFEERLSYIDSHCGDDSVVRGEVERLLARHPIASGYLEEPISAVRQALGAVAWRPTMFVAGDAVNGRFRIVRFIGQGGMGEVYEAADGGYDGARIALKTIRSGMELDEELEARFRREVLIARQISHPNVCRIHELFDCQVEDAVLGGEHTLVFLTMELLQGENLSERLARRGPMKAIEALPLLRGILRGLEEAHGKGVIHRDLKTSNVMLVPQNGGAPKAILTDFGLAISKYLPAPDQTQTRLMGTPAYMAPEQFSGGEAGIATDIFSFGVVFYAMVTGRLPFPGATLTGAARRADALPPPPRNYAQELDARWQRVILRCLEPDPAKRFSSAQQVLAAIEEPSRALQITRRALVACAFAAPAACLSWFWASNSARLAPAVPSMAVLPFQNLSGDPELEYFAEGLTADLAPLLMRLPGVRVVALNSSSQFKAGADLKTIGKRLNVGALLTGSVRKQGARITVTAHLTNLADGVWLWSGSYEEEAKALARIRINLSMALAGALQPRLPATQLAGIAGPQSDNAEAYNLYLLGKHQATYRTDAGLKLSIDYLQQAIERDPRFALAYAALSEGYSILAGRPDCPPQEFLVKAEAAARQALQLDPQLAEAHASLGLSHARLRWDWEAAEREFLKAIHIGPSSSQAHYRYSGFLSDLTRHDPAIHELLIAKDLDPLSPIMNSAYGALLCRARRTPEALAQIQKTIQTYPDFANARRELAEIYGVMGKWNNAVDEYNKALELRNDYYLYQSGLGHALARVGRRSEARTIAEALERSLGTTHYSPTAIANVYRGMDDADRTFHWFDVAVEQRDPMIAWVKADPANDRLRLDPRFARLLERIRM